MSRSTSGWYAFRSRTPPGQLAQVIAVSGRLRADGQLFRFSEASHRSRWLAAQKGGRDWRWSCESRQLPTGWRVQDALLVPSHLPTGGASP